MTELNVKKYKIEGMHCVGCAQLIEEELEDTRLAKEALCKYATSELTVKSDEEIEDHEVIETVAKLGYKAELIK